MKPFDYEAQMSEEPESLILQMLRSMRAEIAGIDARMATKDDVADLRSEMNSFRADVASDFLTVRGDFKEVNERIAGLRRAVMEYHTTTIGHGVLISELEARLRRVEQHLNLESPEAH